MAVARLGLQKRAYKCAKRRAFETQYALELSKGRTTYHFKGNRSFACLNISTLEEETAPS